MRIAIDERQSATWPRVPGYASLLRHARSYLVAGIATLWLPYLLASILILYGFQWGLPMPPYTASSFQPDEGAAVWAVAHIGFPHFNPQIMEWGTGLFYQVYLFKKILTIGGLIHVGDFWLYVFGRLVVYISALGAITATFLSGQKLFDRQTGWLAALFLSVLPGFVITSHYFKPDVPMTFWSVVTLFVILWLLEAPSVRRVVVLGLLVGYSASVKYNAAFLAPVAAIAVALAFRRSGRALSIILLGASALGGFALGEPYAFLDFPSLVHWLRNLQQLDSLGRTLAVDRPAPWLEYPVDIFPYAMTWPFMLLSGAALVAAVIRKTRYQYVLLLLVLTYYLLMGIGDTSIVRYVVPLLPILAILTARLAQDLAQIALGRRLYLPVLAALVGYMFIFSLSFTRVFAQPDPRIQGSMWIQAHLPKDTPIAVSTTHDWNIPQLGLIGYHEVEVNDSIPELQGVKGPYLILSDIPKLEYEEAIDHFPTHKAFYAYVDSHYCVVADFLNSQEMLGVDSRQGSRLPPDWLDPNPRITILKRSPNGCPARNGAS